MLKARFALICAGLSILPSVALAQAKDDDVVSVSRRTDTDYSPLGVRMGGFVLAPSATVNEDYDDNIFRTDGNEQSDFITEFQPDVTLSSDWGVHAIQLDAGGNFGRYIDNTSENYDDFHFSALGRLDFDYNTFLSLLARYDQRHEDRSSPDDPRGDEPVVYSAFLKQISFNRSLGILKLNADLRDTRLEYQNGTRLGVTVFNDLRDRNEDVAEARLGYEFAPNYEAFVKSAYRWVNYDDTGINDRSSTGYDIQTGLALNISGKARGDIYAGYINRDYESFNSISAVNFGGTLLWNITGITTLTGLLERSVEETTLLNTSGYVRTDAQIGVEHALMRNLFLKGRLGIRRDDYVSTGPTTERKDDHHYISFGPEYMPWRGTTLGLKYSYEDRNSNIAGGDFTNNQMLLSLKYAY